MQLLATVQCTVYEDVNVVLWNSTFLHFFQHVLFFPGLCLHLCITVIYFSISLEVTGSVFLFVLFSFNFSFDSCFLLKPLNFPYCSLYLGFIFQLSLLFQLGEDTLFYTVLYQTSSVTTANSKTSCISNCSLVKEDKSPPSTSFLEVL